MSLAKALRIVIDARMHEESGIGRYIRNLLHKLQEIDKKNEYFILLLKESYDTLVYHNKNFHKELVDVGWYSVGEQIKLPKILEYLNPDLVHFPHFNVPVFYRGKFVVTIHDLIHQHFQMKRATTLGPIIHKIKRLGYDVVFKTAVNKAVKILAPSRYVKDLLVNSRGVDGRKIVVTPESVDDNLFSIEKKMSRIKAGKVLTKFNIKTPYLFYVGNAHPHKNIEGLIRAFLKLQQKYSNLKLVLSGYDHYFWQRLKKENKLEGILYTGFINDDELVALYKGAAAFILPSFEEGFGIPILEAMACSCPVASSNTASLPEVGGEAALYFDPSSPDDMAEKISKVLDDENLRLQLVKKGLKRCKKFSWQKLAKKTLEVYLQCA